jgi:hypothetical protein
MTPFDFSKLGLAAPRLTTTVSGVLKAWLAFGVPHHPPHSLAVSYATISSIQCYSGLVVIILSCEAWGHEGNRTSSVELDSSSLACLLDLVMSRVRAFASCTVDKQHPYPVSVVPLPRSW